MRDTAEEVRTSSLVMYSHGPLHMAKQKQSDQLERTYSSCEDTGCSPEDPPEAMNDKEEWRERVRVYPRWWHDMMMMMINVGKGIRH